MKPVLSIIINAFKGKKFLAVFFEGLAKQTFKAFEVIVIDNNTETGEIVDIHDYNLPYPVNFIKINKNIGYGPTLNYGINKARGKYLFILNTDIEFNDAEMLQKVVDFMEAHADYGLLSPQVIENGKPIYNLSSDYIEIESIKGCSMFFRMDAIKKTGPFDPNFRIYAEEDEFCYRIRRHNWKIGVLNSASLTHLGSGVMNVITPGERIDSLVSYVTSNNLLRMKVYSIPKMIAWMFIQYLFSVPMQVLFWALNMKTIAKKFEDKGPNPVKKYRGNICAFEGMLKKSMKISKLKVAAYWFSAKYKSLIKAPAIITNRKIVNLNTESNRFKSLIVRNEKYNY